ncbi:MAG: vitamin K epoxide reductase family protein [Muribaculaceae bacterium]|nr:vitamin K epoxide reductase family protein [Muribaculaceae bacterium]
MARESSLFTDFLNELGVKHTADFSNTQFENMNFKSLFGFSRLLSSYSIPNSAFKIEKINELLKVPVPFMAQKSSSFVIVTGIKDRDNNPTVTWKSQSGVESASAEDFLKGCSGVILQAYPDEKSIEPDYNRHHLLEMAGSAKSWILFLCGMVIFFWGFYDSGLYKNISTVLLTIVDLAGLGITWLLILKSLKVKSVAADNVCGVLQEHGCDHVLEDKASSFFGIFSWSEVGFAYFSVSIAAMLIFPKLIGAMTLINACCLPFTIWSIWYQKFKIKTWCTLCVITQCLLWCQFLCYLLGGWWSTVFPIQPAIIPLGCAYAGAMLSINAVCEFIKKRI